jgi:hypothetical protein
MSRFRQPPLRQTDLRRASAEQLKQQLSYELGEIKDASGGSNEDLALKLGYANGSSVGKWLSGEAALSKSVVKTLDDTGYRPTIGESFSALYQLYSVAKRGAHGPKSPASYHVFLASPMASTKGSAAYRREREAALGVKHVLENIHGYDVFYAGEEIENEDQFDAPRLAAWESFGALSNSRHFLLLALEPVRKPSGVFAEAGYALARGIPSLYIVSDPDHLPYPLRNLGFDPSGSSQLPPVDIEICKTADKAVALVRQNVDRLFAQLDDPRAKPRRRGRGR